MSDALPTQKIAGITYLSCEWCGTAVSQLGTRTPRRYCKRSHRQRAFEARRLGVPMLRDRSADPVHVPEPLPAPVFKAEPVIPDAWRAPTSRRPLSRNRSGITADPFPRGDQLALDVE